MQFTQKYGVVNLLYSIHHNITRMPHNRILRNKCTTHLQLHASDILTHLVILPTVIVNLVIIREEPEHEFLNTRNTIIELPVICHRDIRLNVISRTHREDLGM